MYFECGCCGSSRGEVRHINGDMYDCRRENLVSLCNKCYSQHKENMEEARKYIPKYEQR